EPRKSPTVVIGFGKQRCQRQSPCERADDRTILWRYRVEVVGSSQTSGANHVLGDHLGRTGNVFRHVASEETAKEIVTPANAEPDDDGHCSAFVKILDVGRARRRSCKESGEDERER